VCLIEEGSEMRDRSEVEEGRKKINAACFSAQNQVLELVSV